MSQSKDFSYASLTAVGGRLQEVIQQGFPEVGWRGDPLLTLVRDGDQWQVYDRALNPPKPVLSKPVEGLRDLDFRSMCEKLRDADAATQGPATITERVFARNKAKEEAAKQAIDEVSTATAYELYDTSKMRKTFVL